MVGPRNAVVGCLAVALIFSVVFAPPGSDVSAEDPNLYLEVGQVSGLIGELVEIPVILQTQEDSLAGFAISVTLSRPDLVYFEVDTVIDGDDTNFVCEVDTTGALCSGWEYVEARSIGGKGYNIRLIGLARRHFVQPGDPIPEYTTGLLLRFFGRAKCDIPDLVTDRTVELQVSELVRSTSFSDPQGNLILPIQATDGSVTVEGPELGDLNIDGSINPVDVVFMINRVYRGYAPPCCEESADVNCDSEVNPVDAVLLINQVYKEQILPPC